MTLKVFIIFGLLFVTKAQLDYEINQILAEMDKQTPNSNNHQEAIDSSPPIVTSIDDPSRYGQITNYNPSKESNIAPVVSDNPAHSTEVDDHSKIKEINYNPIKDSAISSLVVDKPPHTPEGYNPNTDQIIPSKEDRGSPLDPVGKVIECQDHCVPFYQCNNGTIVTSGENLIDIRKNDGPCGSALLTCCKQEQVTTDRISTSSTKDPRPVGCGYRNSNGIGFTITGSKYNEAQFAEFPWMVSINRDFGSQVDPKPSCGGALIHPRAVITAAHCVADKNRRWRVRAGEWDINRTIEPIPHQEVEVETIKIHGEYYPGALFNDIAFLYLKTPIKESENVGTICLPPQNFNHRERRCYSTGWGKDKFGKEGKFQKIMKKIDLPFVPRQKCQQNLRKTRLGIFFELHQSFMCAGGEVGKDACNGDGGSPLVCPFENNKSSRYYQAGIVAWGIGCGTANVPGVYVDVARFRHWIDFEMQRHRLDKSSYIVNLDVNPRK